jgi:hypothetical protein
MPQAASSGATPKAGALIPGSPFRFAGIAPDLKRFPDRAGPVASRRTSSLRREPGASAEAGRKAWHVRARDRAASFFGIHRMLTGGSRRRHL